MLAISKRTLETLLVFVLVANALAKQPNVLVFLTDDQGWGDLSLNGNRNLSTPNIDSLASEGASFDRFYVCPVCSPTRAEFLTGRYHPRCGVYSTSAGGERLDLDEATIAESFKAAGYATAAFGKWHNGMQYPYHPNARGFDEYYGFCSGHWGNYFDPMLERNGALTKGKGFVIDDFTNEAMKFIERHRDQPFFVYLPYNTPHSPMQVPDRFWKKFKEHELPMRHRDRKEDMPHARAALAMCENIDWNVGRLLKRLEELDLSRDTIVVFFHDNGPNGSRWNGGMKGRKGSTDEGGVRSPLLVRWPAKIPPGRKIGRIAGAIDLLPTLTSLANVKRVGSKPLDGVNLGPLLIQDEVPWPDRMIFSHWRGRVSVRTQTHRLDHTGELFDLTSDPGQRNPLSSNVKLKKDLQDVVAQWKSTVLSALDSDDRPFVIGHPDTMYTQLPARDGIARGNIKRSNRFPNCSFFTNWRSTDDKIEWNVELPADGHFGIEVYYTCPAADVGSVIELRFGDAVVRSKVTEANDPPLAGAEHDRAVRTESYVKAWKSLKMGTLALRKGAGTLTLSAPHIPRSQAMDFRLLMLTRVD